MKVTVCTISPSVISPEAAASSALTSLHSPLAPPPPTAAAMLVATAARPRSLSRDRPPLYYSHLPGQAYARLLLLAPAPRSRRRL